MTTRGVSTGGAPPSSKRAHIDLRPDADEEAFELLVAHVDFVTIPVMTFARLVRPIQTGCEGATPVRFLFLLLALGFTAPASSS